MTAKTPFAALLASVAVALLPSLLPAQDEEWEGKVVKEVFSEGFRRHRFANFQGKLTLREGKVYDRKLRDLDLKALFATGHFDHEGSSIECKLDRGQVVVTVIVKEYPLVEGVTFKGNRALSDAQLKTSLRITPNSQLNPSDLKRDEDALIDQYVSKGHHFSRVRAEKAKSPDGTVQLTWAITEGPMVAVEAIEFSGADSVSESDLRKYILSKHTPKLLFIPLGSEPFVARNIEQDIERIKLFYRLEGWLDIYPAPGQPERVFLEDLVFSDDKSKVVIKYHVDEGERYKIQDILIKNAAGGGDLLFSAEEIRSWLLSKPGEFYTENNASRDAKKIRDKYGERAYILSEVDIAPAIMLAGRAVNLQITIRENEKQYAGKVTIQGNSKTRDDVIRRYVTLYSFLPGEEFNARSLTRAINRLRSTGWFGGDPLDPDRGVSMQHAPGAGPNERDVTIEVKEGETGNVRFAAGYSSAFGVIGVLEINQRNFDLTDWPKSLEEVINGEGFAGGGQNLRIRLSPSARRQSFLIEFKEPFVFGEEFGLGLRGYSTFTSRESWDEARFGGSLFLDKTVDVFRFELAFAGYQIKIDDIDGGAPASVVELEGTNVLMSVTPGVSLNTLDSPIFPSSGAKILMTYEYAGQLLSGDFDFNKLTFDTEFFFPIYETESKLKHVLSLQFTFGWVEERRDATSVPLFERFYAGGRGSIRGFEFRGIGPRENGDPVGGEAYLFASVEYSFPLFTEILRGAVFWDIANLAPEISALDEKKFRNSIGFGVRFIIPQLSSIPVALDFGYALTEDDEDDEQTITFDIGRLF